MINAGIIGLGPVWEERYESVLLSLSNRVRITAIYDAAEERSATVARSLNADCVTGIQTLCRRREIDTCLILGTDWTNLPALKFLCEARKPAYIAGSLGHEIPTIGEIHLLALSEGLTFVPEFSRRYTPATIRLRELIATKLGQPERIICEARLPHPTKRDTVPGQARYEDFLIGLFDWCHHLMNAPPKDVLTLPLEKSEGKGYSVRIRFGSHQDEPEKEIEAVLTIWNAVQTGKKKKCQLEPGEVRTKVIAQHGSARIRGANEISWEHEGKESIELLTADRPDAEVMLDHFFRRIVGGLVPVADLSDICRAINVFRAFESSKETGALVLVPGGVG
ncbi:MAG TPA: Gfo/Idh/MocA family oxidoreductase [Planctomycetaceae bacterium]|nr:Gfo/Idh/MocA family oxidoreductase [Planctomycetaceae bacterium]